MLRQRVAKSSEPSISMNASFASLSNRRGASNAEMELPGLDDPNAKSKPINIRSKLSRIIRYALLPVVFLFCSLTIFVPNFKGYNPVSKYCFLSYKTTWIYMEIA